jgi:hypothetical protein
MNGGDIFKLQKVLGHKSVQMTMRYAHLAPNAFAADYGRLGPVAISVPSKVLDFRVRAARSLRRSFPARGARPVAGDGLATAA